MVIPINSEKNVHKTNIVTARFVHSMRHGVKAKKK